MHLTDANGYSSIAVSSLTQNHGNVLSTARCDNEAEEFKERTETEKTGLTVSRGTCFGRRAMWLLGYFRGKTRRIPVVSD